MRAIDRDRESEGEAGGRVFPAPCRPDPVRAPDTRFLHRPLQRREHRLGARGLPALRPPAADAHRPRPGQEGPPHGECAGQKRACPKTPVSRRVIAISKKKKDTTRRFV